MKSSLGDSEIELTGNSVFVSFRFVLFFFFSCFLRFLCHIRVVIVLYYCFML